MIHIAQTKFAFDKIGKNEMDGVCRRLGKGNVLNWVLVGNTGV